MGVGVGDRLAAVPYWSDETPYIHVLVTGLFEAHDPDDEFWHLNEKIFRASTTGTFRTLPFYVTEKAYFETLGAAFGQMNSTYGWLLMVDEGKLDANNSSLARASLAAMEDRLTTNLFSYRQITELEDVLTEYDLRLFFSKLPMFVALVLIAVVVLYYVATLSSLVVERQRGEIVLLKSRGASSAQVLSVYVMEGLTVAALSILVAPPLASAAISLMGYTPAFSDLSGGGRLSIGLSAGAYAMAAVGGLLSFAALLAPAIQASRMSVTTFRQQSARPYTQPFYQRYYLDVLLLAIGVLLLRQLSEQGSVVAVGIFGEVAVNQALLAVPAIMLAASALALLRLFPLFMRVSSALLSSFLPAGLALGVWQMARNPTHYARLSLMLILMAGLGIFAASFGGTLQRNFEDRALYATGADLRLQGMISSNAGYTLPMRETLEAMPAVEEATLAFRGFGSDLSKIFAESYTMFAVEGDRLKDLAWYRDDFADTPIEDMLGSLSVEGLPEGAEIPAEAVGIGARVKPGQVASERRAGGESSGRQRQAFHLPAGRTGREGLATGGIFASARESVRVREHAPADGAAQTGVAERSRDQRAQPAALRLAERGRNIRADAGRGRCFGGVVRFGGRVEPDANGSRGEVGRVQGVGLGYGRRRVHLGGGQASGQQGGIPRPAKAAAARDSQQPLPADERPPRRGDDRGVRPGAQAGRDAGGFAGLLPVAGRLQAVVPDNRPGRGGGVRQPGGEQRRDTPERSLDEDRRGAQRAGEPVGRAGGGRAVRGAGDSRPPGGACRVAG